MAVPGYATNAFENYKGRVQCNHVMPPEPSREVTKLLRAWNDGDAQALDSLTPLVYQELRRIARRHMQRERSGHTLQATGLVNEAFLRLVDAQNISWQDRAHFFAIAAQVMRRVLVEAARASGRSKRGGQAHKVTWDEGMAVAPERSAELLALDEALHALARQDLRKSRVVELRFFGGLSVEETAEILKISPQSVMRDWRLAKSWLAREMG